MMRGMMGRWGARGRRETRAAVGRRGATRSLALCRTGRWTRPPRRGARATGAAGRTAKSALVSALRARRGAAQRRLRWMGENGRFRVSLANARLLGSRQEESGRRGGPAGERARAVVALPPRLGPPAFGGSVLEGHASGALSTLLNACNTVFLLGAQAPYYCRGHERCGTRDLHGRANGHLTLEEPPEPHLPRGGGGLPGARARALHHKQVRVLVALGRRRRRERLRIRPRAPIPR
mmetsp:Transcript_54825/g.174200  ORF Transcript_54825/g.174200 Transcript_54825/m.174200 type:complete len:236 (+) Transcript_54825:554-1261(+)